VPVQPSPAVLRAAKMLRAVAEEPERGWTLSELSRAVGSYPSTCQTVVMALIDGGLLVRERTGANFRLGPVLIALGDRARKAINMIDLAETELTTLRDRHRATAMLGMVSGTSIITTVVKPFDHPLGYGVVPNMAVPLRAPIGSIYVAWSPSAEIDGWLQRGSPDVDHARARTLKSDLALVRERGWSATVRRRDRTDAMSYLELREFSPEDEIPLIGISAAVKSGDGEVVYSLALSTFPDLVSGVELLAMAEDLLAASARLRPLDVLDNRT
jgi:DNA-binding IclR family transcriptional regulator